MFKNLTDKQLKKRNKICLAIAIVILGVMAFFVGVSLYLSSHETSYEWVLYLVPSVILPLTMVPILFSIAISSETKRREKEK